MTYDGEDPSPGLESTNAVDAVHADGNEAADSGSESVGRVEEAYSECSLRWFVPEAEVHDARWYLG